MRLIFLVLLLLLPLVTYPQADGFPFGRVTWDELNMNAYAGDTTAVAIILDEFGKADINEANGNLSFEHHVKLKILRKSGLYLSDFSIPLYKYSNGEKDFIREIKASSFSPGPNGIAESQLDGGSVFTEKYEEGELKKFAIPNVTVGSVIEVYYRLESPYIFNFREWDFQREIPKLHSEYWAMIPAYYHYNISLIGFLKLSKDESEVVRNCFSRGVDCTLMKFAIDSIPAFVEEEHMTAKRNFISAINFELAEVHHPTGYVDKITREWGDVEDELRKDHRFGTQLKRGGNAMSSIVEEAIAGEKDPLQRAHRVYDFIVGHYTWNGTFGKYCERGIKEAFEDGKGNVGDLNLSLVAGLRYAGLNADPVILSTRENRRIGTLFPALSDFNYVLAKVTINEKEYLLDATDPLIPFGMIPFRCLNGKGRVIGDKKSSWQEMHPDEKFKQTSYISLTLGEDGLLKGSLQNTYQGYDALNKRKLIYSFASIEAYKANLGREFNSVTVTKLEVKNLDDVTKPLIEIIDVESSGFDEVMNTFLLNPFLIYRTSYNPFKSSSRLYPVDFGAELDKRITITLLFPDPIQLLNSPEDIGLSLPNGGGSYILRTQRDSNKVTIFSLLKTERAIYTAEEYHYLKELYDRIVQVQNADLIFKKT
jgi:Transglutaminase-like superfamily